MPEATDFNSQSSSSVQDSTVETADKNNHADVLIFQWHNVEKFLATEPSLPNRIPSEDAILKNIKRFKFWMWLFAPLLGLFGRKLFKDILELLDWRKKMIVRLSSNPLFGTWSRQMLNWMFDEVIAKIPEQHKIFPILHLFLDIDYLKYLNDRYGKDQANRVIQTIVQFVLGHARTGTAKVAQIDRLFRILDPVELKDMACQVHSGDEIDIVIFGVLEDIAKDLMERFKLIGNRPGIFLRLKLLQPFGPPDPHFVRLILTEHVPVSAVIFPYLQLSPGIKFGDMAAMAEAGIEERKNALREQIKNSPLTSPHLRWIRDMMLYRETERKGPQAVEPVPLKRAS